MKTNLKNIGLLALATILFASCTNNENLAPIPPTAASFFAIKEQGVKKATEDNGQWRYAIKAVTVQAGDVYTFTLAETTVVTEAQLVAAINAIQ